MPYIKPGDLYEIQRQIAGLVKLQGDSLEECPESVRDFLRTNPVNGKVQDRIRIAKVNDVWVDLDDVSDAEEMDHAFVEQELPEFEADK